MELLHPYFEPQQKIKDNWGLVQWFERRQDCDTAHCRTSLRFRTIYYARFTYITLDEENEF